jgi:hypothetical protein
VVRLRGDRFDARALVGDAAAPPSAAQVRLAALLAERARAARLPEGPEARLRVFASLAAYEREVLGAPDPD